MKKFELILLIAAIISIFTYLYYMNIWHNEQMEELKKRPLVDLPEEYNMITSNDTLKGYYTGDGILHIEFNNQRNK